jgi:hypothetical protein
MSAFFAEFKAAILVAAGLILLGALYAYGHMRYESGRQNRIDYYEPILKAANDAKIAADTRARDAEHAAQTITEDVNHVAETKLADLAAERDAALAGVRDAQDRARRRQSVPALPGGTGASPRPAEVARCDLADQIALDAAANGQHDALELAAWLDWYARQAAAFKQYSQESSR